MPDDLRPKPLSLNLNPIIKNQGDISRALASTIANTSTAQSAARELGEFP